MSNFPKTIRVRDTKIHDDLGGAGQRIYTTAGQGYDKQKYVRADCIEKLEDEIERLRAALEDALPCLAEHDPEVWDIAREALNG